MSTEPHEAAVHEWACKTLVSRHLLADAQCADEAITRIWRDTIPPELAEHEAPTWHEVEQMPGAEVMEGSINPATTACIVATGKVTR